MSAKIVGSIAGTMILFFSGQASSATLEITEVDDGLILSYEIEASATSHVLGLIGQVGASARLLPVDKETTITDGNIYLPSPSNRFQLRLLPDVTEKSAAYPVLTRILGRGYVLYAPAVLPTGRKTRVRYKSNGNVVQDFNSIDALNGYVFLGEKDTSIQNYDLVVGKNVPHSLRDEILSRIDKLLPFYTNAMKRAPSQRPLIVLSSVDADENVNRGDVSRNGVVLLRYMHSASTPLEERFRSRSTQFLAHELFHLWMNHVPEDPRHRWFQEGAAEYATLLSLQELWPGSISLGRYMEAATDSCVGTLRHLPLDQAPYGMGGRFHYTCGSIIHWIADLGMRASGNSSIFDVWRVLWEPKNGPDADLIADFLRNVNRESQPALRLIQSVLTHKGTERWQKFEEGLGELGVDVEIKPPTAFSMRIAATQAIVLSACGEFWGAGEKEGQHFGQGPPSCEFFGNSQIIEDVDGVSPMDDAKKYLDMVSEKCASNKRIVVSLKSTNATQTDSIVCETPVQLPAPRFSFSDSMKIAPVN